MPRNEEFLEQHKPGAVVEERGLASADVDKPWGGNVDLVIDSQHGKDISELSSSNHFHEVLFGPDSKFTVDQRSFDEESGKWEIRMSEKGEA